MNNNYGKLINGILTFAPINLIIDDMQVINAEESDYVSAGYLPIQYTIKPDDNEWQAVYTEVDGRILQSWVYEGRIHDHSNLPLLEGVTAKSLAGVPAVHILPTDAEDGDICFYAPQNTLTLADGGKRIYFDWEEFRKPVGEGELTQLSLQYNTMGGDIVIEIGAERNLNNNSIWLQRTNVNDGTQETLWVSFTEGVLDVEGAGFEIDAPSGIVETTYFNSIDEIPLYFDIPEFDDMVTYDLTGNAYLFHTEYRLMKYQGGEWIEAVEADVTDEQIAAAVRDYINENPIEGGSVEIDTTLTQDGKAADAKATGDRLTDIEYQTVTTDLAYEHKGLPIGEKTVTVSGDGTFGNNAYIVSGEDMIPRKTFNRTFPYNGITITRNDKTYHIEGTTTASGIVCFTKTQGSGWIDVTGDVSGKSFKLITFVNKAIGSLLISAVQFFDANQKVVNVTDKNGTSKSKISGYFAGDTLSKVTNFSIPEGVNIAYMQATVEFYADKVLDHDFQFYVVEDDDAQAVTLENPTATITDTEITNVFSAPYQNTTETKAPIADYIKYMTANAKGDTATYLTPEAFGAIGDGYTDDINAITACLAMAKITKQTVLMAKKYLVSAPIDINGDDFNIYINDIVYSGTDTAVKIHGQRNTVKIHSVTSSGIGVKFLGDGTTYSEWTLYNSLEINTITAASHGVTFTVETAGSYQNTVRFNYIKAGGAGCYGIAYFNLSDDIGSFGEDNFYGGQISNCEWACYGIRGNSKFYGIQVEGNVQGGFYIFDHVQIFHPRITESQRDGNLPIYKFLNTDFTTIYDSSGISINQIDLSEAVDVTDNGAPLVEGSISKINGTIYARIPATNENTMHNVYCRDAYIWGKYLIMTPFMAYRKEVTTATLDTRLIGQEATETEIRALSQLPTKFVVNTTNTDIYLHESYCAFGFNEFEVEQANGFTCKVYDKLNNLIFDGTEQGDGLYKLNVYKDATYCASRSGVLRIDFMGHYWSVTKINAYNPMPEISITASESNTLMPNVDYDFGEVETLTINFADSTPYKHNEYLFSFTSGATPTVLTLPASVQWANELTIEANKRYEISIVDNIGLWCAVEVSV